MKMLNVIKFFLFIKGKLRFDNRGLHKPSVQTTYSLRVAFSHPWYIICVFESLFDPMFFSTRHKNYGISTLRRYLLFFFIHSFKNFFLFSSK